MAKIVNNLINKEDIKEVLYTKEQIIKEAKRIVKDIESNPNYDFSNSIFATVLEGGSSFAYEFTSLLKDNVITDSLKIKSYVGTTKNESKILKPLDNDPRGKVIYLIDELIDSGGTIEVAKEYCKKIGAIDVKVVAMIEKPEHIQNNVKIDYKCFELRKDDWLVGFGLDCNGCCRTLPFVASLTEAGKHKLMKKS